MFQKERKVLSKIRFELSKNYSFRSKISVLVYRIGNIIEKSIKNRCAKRIALILYILVRLLCNLIGCGEIPHPSIEIGWGLRVPHCFNGVFINKSCKIGSNVTLFHNVTIGAIEGDTYQNSVEIEDNVYIGTGATILGNAVIGKNCKIGAGTLIINKVIGDNMTIISENKLRIIGENDE